MSVPKLGGPASRGGAHSNSWYEAGNGRRVHIGLVREPEYPHGLVKVLVENGKRLAKPKIVPVQQPSFVTPIKE